MLRPQGYITITDDHMVEHDTITCGHCNRVIIVKPGTSSTVYLFPRLHIDTRTKQSTIVQQEEAGAFCRLCMRAVCLPCHDIGTCTPLLQRLEASERLKRPL